MLNFKRLAPRSADTYRYTHNNEKITHQEADMINDGTFIEDQTSVPGEYITAQEVVQKLAAQHKHVNYMIGGDELNELVCYYTWSSDTVDPTSVYIPDLQMTVGDRKLLAYEITPENADVTSAEFSITNGSSIAHIEDSYIVADQQGTATYKVVVNGSIEATATVNVSNKPEEFPDDAQHRWIRVQPESSQIPVDGGTIHVTGSYGLTGSYGTEKKVGDITDTIVIESNSSYDSKNGSKTYYYNNNQFDTPTAEITWTQPGRSEEFPDDEEHRWIEVSPTQFTFPADGGSVDITGSYGLTGTFGTRNKVGDITDTITIEPNSSQNPKSGSKTYHYNNNEFDTPTAEVTWTQPGREEIFTYQYHIYVGTSAENIQDNAVSLVWQNDNYGQSSKKSVYVRAYKDKVNESNQVVSTESVTYGIRGYISDGNQFSVDNNSGLIECYPLQENTDYSTSKEIGLQIFIEEHDTCFCNVSLIQERKGIQIISGDAIMFTYNWDKGRDLDQATFVNLNLQSSNKSNYAGYLGTIDFRYKKILYFAGDNTGIGNEYAFIDFKEIYKYLSEYGDDPSSIDGKTILQSLTNDNGVIQIQCDLYTNWFNIKEQEDITLTYSVYNKDSENASVTATDDKQFVLNGYTKISDSSDQALCHAKGQNNVLGDAIVKNTYTLSAKFTYYFNSGVFAFETNKNDVGKWQLGTSWDVLNSDPTYSDVQFSNDGENINFAISIDSVNEPDYFIKSDEVNFSSEILLTDGLETIHELPFQTLIGQLPYKVNYSVPLSQIVEKIDFGEADSAEIHPYIHFEKIEDENSAKLLQPSRISLTDSAITIQKPST